MRCLKRVIDDVAAADPRDQSTRFPSGCATSSRKLHAKKPADRFQTAKEVAELLGQHLAHLQQPMAAPMPAPSPMRQTPVEDADDFDGKVLGRVSTPAIGLFVTGILYWAAIPFAFWLRFQPGVPKSDADYLWWRSVFCRPSRGSS